MYDHHYRHHNHATIQQEIIRDEANSRKAQVPEQSEADIEQELQQQQQSYKVTHIINCTKYRNVCL